MLFGKDFRRSHHTSLVTVVFCQKHGKQRHESLSAAYVALNETVHLYVAVYIAPYFAYDTLLRPCKFKREILAVEAVEHIPYLCKAVACVFVATLF